MLHVYCKTPVALLLMAVDDERGVMRFPTSGDPQAPGLRLAVRARLPINEQLMTLAAETLGTPVALKLDIVQEFADELVLADGTECTVYLGRMRVTDDKLAPAPAEWPSFPALLRGMAKDRRRLPFLRAWQILSGGLQLETKAIEATEALRHFDK